MEDRIRFLEARVEALEKENERLRLLNKMYHGEWNHCHLGGDQPSEV